MGSFNGLNVLRNGVKKIYRGVEALPIKKIYRVDGKLVGDIAEDNVSDRIDNVETKVDLLSQEVDNIETWAGLYFIMRILSGFVCSFV